MVWVILRYPQSIPYYYSGACVPGYIPEYSQSTHPAKHTLGFSSSKVPSRTIIREHRQPITPHPSPLIHNATIRQQKPKLGGALRTTRSRFPASILCTSPPSYAHTSTAMHDTSAPPRTPTTINRSHIRTTLRSQNPLPFPNPYPHHNYHHLAPPPIPTSCPPRATTMTPYR